MKTRKTGFARIRRRVGLRAAKIWRGFTANQRALPDFVIIGVQKGGTTSLHKYLRQHPDVVPSYKKEVKFFDCNYDKGLDWYRAHFPYEGAINHVDLQTGEASPHYIFHPLAPERIAEVLPKVKLIALLRDPVERAFSHYQGNVRAGRESLTFEEAIASEKERLDGIEQKIRAGLNPPLHNYLHYSYLAKGIYADQLKNWFRYFNRSRILILNSEAFYQDPDSVYQQVLEFLELPSFQLDSYQVYNAGFNKQMKPETREELRNFFLSYNERLFELLDVDYGWNHATDRERRPM